MTGKVGIVVVSYNAAIAVRATLASLRRARNKTAYELLLIDNASAAAERRAMQSALERHVAETGLCWRYVQLEENLGFAGGNNVGIERFLRDESVSHICLLNSDVLVSDFWLDRLVGTGCEIVSAVTNKADSEQCVPIDYALDLAGCFDAANEAITPEAYALVNAFAQDWHRAWRGNMVEAEVTFFCVLLTRRLVQRVGLLDTNFFPGGYEDDDYCARVRAEGCAIHLARDVFIHHWGSASFGQLQAAYFNQNAVKNRTYLEQKHGFQWKRRPQMPLVSYGQDLLYALAGQGDRSLQPRFLALYARMLEELLARYDREFDHIGNALHQCRRPVTAELRQQVEKVAASGALGDAWCRLRAVPDDGGKEARRRIEGLAEKVYARATCNLAMHEFLTASGSGEGRDPVSSGSGWRKVLGLLRKGAAFLWQLRGVVFFGGYPYPEREQDGYFQRIRAIDALFADRWRIYVDHETLSGRDGWYDRPAPGTLVLRVTGGRQRRLLIRLLAVACALRCRVVYFHSVLRMHESSFGRLLLLPWLTRFIDIHGVVPEEFRYHHDYYSASLFDRHERRAVRHADHVVVVSAAMRDYLRQKYRDEMRGANIIFPIFPRLEPRSAPRPYPDGMPVVVYAGGLHKWQQVPKMIEAIARTIEVCRHRFYCPDPAALSALLPPELRAHPHLTVASQPHAALLRLYPECHYGFILREDSIVNHAACPTKLVEYLAMGIVPIVDCETIGDFQTLGLQAVRLADFVAGRLPTAEVRDRMAENNLAVYERLQEQHLSGAASLQAALALETRALSARVREWAKFVCPPATRRGQVARRLWLRCKMAAGRHPVPPAAAAPPVLPAPPLPPCDVLMQVENFLAGGLENVVLDLSATLIQAGFRVHLLVLGEAGAAVERARAEGIAVCVTSFDANAYRALLRQTGARLVISHYSLHGARICGELRLPLLQVLHNAYMWLVAEQVQEFRAAIRHTTAFVAVSPFVRDYSIARFGVPAERCLVIPNGIDLARFRTGVPSAVRVRLRAEFGIADGDFVFLCVGSINHQKNPLGALRAFHAARPECPGARLVFLGTIYEKELFAAMQEYIDRHLLAGQVLYAGAADDPRPYYRMADALVHPAFFEGGPLVLLEALASNLPAIIAETGIAAIFRHQPGVVLLPPPVDLLTYSGSIEELHSTPAWETSLAAAMARVCAKRMPPDLSAAELETLDKKNSYRAYTELVTRLVVTGSPGAMPAAEELPGADDNEGTAVWLGQNAARG